jgi:hypothetical protein
MGLVLHASACSSLQCLDSKKPPRLSQEVVDNTEYCIHGYPGSTLRLREASSCTVCHSTWSRRYPQLLAQVNIAHNSDTL